MLDPLTWTLAGLSLLLAALAGAYVARDRLTDRWLLVPAAVLELGLLAQLVVGVVRLAGTDRDVSGATFVGYLVGLLLILPAAAFWARGEPSRAGTAVWVVAGLVVPFLLLRLDTIWTYGA